MAPASDHEQLRAAYRRLARTTHPDAAGEASASSMAGLNEAWRVLSDPARRAVYDASLRTTAAAGPRVDRARDEELYPVAARADDPRSGRFPVVPVVLCFLAACAFIVIFGSRGGGGGVPAADWRIEVGSCVEIRDNLDAVEVDCNAAHDGVVRLLVPFDTSCPIDTQTHRDQQGLGNVCVDVAGA